jgi:hypothetical protein
MDGSLPQLEEVQLKKEMFLTENNKGDPCYAILLIYRKEQQEGKKKPEESKPYLYRSKRIKKESFLGEDIL